MSVSGFLLFVVQETNSRVICVWLLSEELHTDIAENVCASMNQVFYSKERSGELMTWEDIITDL